LISLQGGNDIEKFENVNENLKILKNGQNLAFDLLFETTGHWFLSSIFGTTKAIFFSILVCFWHPCSSP